MVKNISFEYKTENGEVIIVGYKDKTVTHIEIPSEIDGYPVTTITNATFNGCNHLKSVIIPNSVTSMNVCTFYGCLSLKMIIIPNSVEYIGANSFRGCKSLKKINDNKFINGLTVINNKLISSDDQFYTVKYQIGDDYCGNQYGNKFFYFINRKKYETKF